MKYICYILENWRRDLRSALLQAVFGVTCLYLVQIPVSALLDTVLWTLVAFTLGYIISGHVNYALHSVITYGKNGPGWDHIKKPDLQWLRRNYVKFIVITAALSPLNSLLRIVFSVFIENDFANGGLATIVTGIINWLINKLIIHTRKATRREKG